jgi:hypothetical protein
MVSAQACRNFSIQQAMYAIWILLFATVALAQQQQQQRRASEHHALVSAALQSVSKQGIGMLEEEVSRIVQTLGEDAARAVAENLQADLPDDISDLSPLPPLWEAAPSLSDMSTDKDGYVLIDPWLYLHRLALYK